MDSIISTSSLLITQRTNCDYIYMMLNENINMIINSERIFTVIKITSLNEFVFLHVHNIYVYGFC